MYCVSRNSEPNIAKKIRVIEPLAAVNRGFLKNAHVEHRVVGVRLPPREHAEEREAADEARDDRRARPALGRRLDDRVEDRGERSRSTAPRRPDRASVPPDRATSG